MIKYAVNTAIYEFNPNKCDSVNDAFFKFDGSQEAKMIALFDTIEAARELLATIKVSTIRFSRKLARASVAYIEEADFDYDEDLDEWEFISGSDIWDFSCEELENE